MMQSYWTNFAKTGDPNGSAINGGDLPQWPQYKPEQYPVMHLNPMAQAAPDTLRPRYLYWDAVARANRDKADRAKTARASKLVPTAPR